MNSRLTAAERRYITRVKCLPCGVCGHPAPSDAHHTRQGDHYTTIPLCRDCHTGGLNGIHGQRRVWKTLKLDEKAVLNATIGHLNRLNPALNANYSNETSGLA